MEPKDHDLTVTRHADRRIRQRVGLPRSAVTRNAQSALEHGLRHSDTRGGLHRYIQALYWKYQSANNTRVYNGCVYIFHDDILITVFPLPQKYRGTAQNIRRKERDSDE